VGNATVEENLAEIVQVVLWNLLGSASHVIAIDVKPGGTIVLHGKLPANARPELIVEAVRHARGVSAVVDRLTVRTPHESRHSAAGSQPIVGIRRFCAADEASTSAAIRQGVARLDAWFSQHGELSDRLIIIYRNLRQNTVTLDIAMPSGTEPELPAGSELRRKHLALLAVAQTVAEPGFAALLEAQQKLHQGTAQFASNSSPAFWQVFDAADFRPWKGHPRAPLYVGEARSLVGLPPAR
jgi:hypothetical protein